MNFIDFLGNLVEFGNNHLKYYFINYMSLFSRLLWHIKNVIGLMEQNCYPEQS